MGLLRKIFGGKQGAEDPVVALDQPRRAQQLSQLARCLNALAAEMREDGSMDNPGWRERVNEYRRLAGTATELSKGDLTWEAVLDLAFEIRPVFSAQPPAGMERIAPLQAEVMAVVEQLRTPLPSERPQ